MKYYLKSKISKKFESVIIKIEYKKIVIQKSKVIRLIIDTKKVKYI